MQPGLDHTSSGHMDGMNLREQETVDRADEETSGWAWQWGAAFEWHVQRQERRWREGMKMLLGVGGAMQRARQEVKLRGAHSSRVQRLPDIGGRPELMATGLHAL